MMISKRRSKMNSVNETGVPVQNLTDSLSEAYSENIRPFIDVIDNLRRSGLQQDISLPNVVVVGDQSSGKSSIIEAISGIQLPRGKGIVTRCPLELQLKRVIKEPWKATLSYMGKGGKSESIEMKDPSLVEMNIQEAQEKMCGSSKNISHSLLTLRVESPAPTAPDLTLIDLPGIARIALEGQSPDICEKIKNIIMDHIKNENTVILCVISANLDAAVNESIRIAKQVDETGSRTLGVITKPDTADEANKVDVLELLNNEKIKLVKGFHMVRCRSQVELDKKLSLKQSLENEEKYFNTDKYYREAAKSQTGTMNLARRITQELVGVIHVTLPGLKDKIATLLQESQQKLCELPREVPESNPEKLMYLVGVISDLTQEIKSCLISGKSSSNSTNMFYNWRKLFNKMRTRIDALKENAMSKRFTIDKLRQEILEKRGNEICGFLNFQLFENIITNHVISYKVEADSLLKEMKNHTILIINQIIHIYFEHLPLVESSLKQIAHNQMEALNNKSSERINTIFEEEKLVFTSDSAFEQEMDSLKEEEYKKRSILGATGNFNFRDDSVKKNTKRMLNIINCYLKIVHSRLSDLIPMSIRQCLHVELSQKLKEKFIEYATAPGIEMKISENNIIHEKRINLQSKIKRLQHARDELSKF